MSNAKGTGLRKNGNAETGAFNESPPHSRTLAEAEAEIARLQEELDQAREELDSLSEVTSGFVRLMI